MNQVFEFIRRHWIGLVMSLVVGLIIAGPNLIFLNSSLSKGIPFMGSDAESFYLSRVNAAYRGCIMSCNPFIKEYKSSFPFYDSSISEAALAVPGMVSGVSAVQMKIVYDFLLPTILAFLIYLLTYRLTKTISLSVLCALFIMLGYDLLNTYDFVSFPALADLFRLKANLTEFLPYARPVNPQFSSIVFLVYLHVLLSCFRKQTVKWFLLLSVMYALSFYAYFYLYTFLTVVNSMAILLHLTARQYRPAVYMSASMLISIVLSSPIIFEVYKTVNHPHYSQLPTAAIEHTHSLQITLAGTLLLGFAIIAAFFYRRNFHGKISADAYFVISLIMTSFVILNQQIITGIINQPFHYHWYYATPVLVISLCYACHIFICKDTLVKYSAFLIAVGALPILNSLIIQNNSLDQNIGYIISVQNETPVLLWLSDHVPSGAVIFSPNRLAALIPVYTPTYLVWAPYAGLYLHEPGRDNAVAEMSLSPESLKKGITKYEVDYIITENSLNRQDNNFDFDVESTLKRNASLVYEDNYFSVYKVR